MKEIVVYVHGKGGSAQEAEHYKALFPDCGVIGFDYRAQAPWEATEEFPGFFAALRKRCESIPGRHSYWLEPAHEAISPLG